MPRPTDDEIVDWKSDYTGADTNVPQGTDVVGSFLDDQLRIIKNVARLESVNKQWERWLGQIASFNFVNATSFTMPGDQTGVAFAGRRIKATVTAGTVYGTIVSSVFGVTTTTTVVLDSGALDAGLSEVQFGAMTLLNSSFPAGLLQQTSPFYAVASGTDTYTATLSPAILAYVVGPYVIKFTNANTTAATLALNGLTAKPIVKNGASALVGGEIGAGQIRQLYYDGTNFQLESVVSAGTPGVAMGSSGSTATLIGLANVQVGTVGTPANTTETTLFTYTLPASAMVTNGQGVRITAWSHYASTSRNRTIRIYFGSTAIIANTDNNGDRDFGWQAVVIRTGAATQAARGGQMNSTLEFTSPTQTLTSPVIIKITGQNSAAVLNDIVGYGLMVEYLS